ncbi:MAG: PBP1A family penicillin-binding protein [Alphaproteobacteria bacterium]|nr:PBP1A family penicillin-binding protein [Alphaproteobacteria bacterium]
MHRSSKLRRILRALARATALVTLAALVAGVLGFLWLDRNILSTLPEDLSSWRGWRPPTTCKVYAADGSLVDEFWIERRTWVPLDELPEHAWQAFLAAEDRRFFEHQGVDPLGILRAMVVNLQAGGVRQGGSTLTQQLVKNLMVGDARSYERKLREAVLAYRLERELSKHQILELFINFVFLGSGNYGLEAASQDYFGVSARDIDPGQAAMLAGLIPAPSLYNPRNDPLRAAERRAIVLRAMVAAGSLPEADVEGYLDDPVLTPGRPRVDPGRDASYPTLVRRELRRLLPGLVAFEQGIQLRTALEPAIQAEAEAAVREALRALVERQGRQGATRRLPPDQRDAFLRRAPRLRRSPQGEPLAPGVGECFEAIVPEPVDLERLGAGPFTFALREADRVAPVRDPEGEAGPAPLRTRIRPGDVLDVCLEASGQVALSEAPWAQGAAVVLENRTGRILAVVGGQEVALEGFVRAAQAERQPGSSFKPYVYAAALLSGRSSLDTVLDAPISLPAGGGKSWSPQNYGGGYAGALPMRSALARSLNTVAVRLAMEVGPAEVVRLARAMGVRTRIREDLTIALGSSEVTPLDQALGYATIARMGQPVDPVFIDAVVGRDGQVLARAGEPLVLGPKATVVLPGGPLPRALPAGVAYELADMMREVVRAGTARRAWDPDYDRAGKTGTTNGFQDAWFVGFTPRYTVAVWVGTDGTSALGSSETGGRTALPAWLRIVQALDQPAGERFMMPAEATLVRVNGQWMGFGRGRVPASALRAPVTPRGTPLPDFPQGRR